MSRQLRLQTRLQTRLQMFPPMGRPPSPGFTLIELVNIMAVVVVLGTVAIPIYNEYIRSIHRADARAGLQQARQWLEQATLEGAPLPASPPAALTWSDDARKRYTIGFLHDSASNGPAYTLVARRRGPQLDDRCGDFTLTHKGVPGSLNLQQGSSPQECWGL